MVAVGLVGLFLGFLFDQDYWRTVYLSFL